MEPASTCFHYHHPQSITSLMKITNSEILLKRIAVTGPHARLPSRGLALRASPEGSQRGAKGDEGRGKGRLRHLGGAPFRGLAPLPHPAVPGAVPLPHNAPSAGLTSPLIRPAPLSSRAELPADESLHPAGLAISLPALPPPTRAGRCCSLFNPKDEQHRHMVMSTRKVSVLFQTSPTPPHPAISTPGIACRVLKMPH